METMREEYARRMEELRERFSADRDGFQVLTARTALVDDVLRRFCAQEHELEQGVAVVALGGYGRKQLFPHSDVDLLFCVRKGDGPRDAIRRVTQGLWDCGMRVSPVTRPLKDSDRFHAENPEAAFALLDRRLIAGDEALFAELDARVRDKMLARDAKSMRTELLAMTRERHRKYGDTLFHLEPNLKECPGGVRDAHVTGWLRMLREDGPMEEELSAAVRFLSSARCFLHFRHMRDDNTLNWQAQDAAAAAHIGMRDASGAVDAAYWMRAYFRHARSIDRCLMREMEAAGLRLFSSPFRKLKSAELKNFRLRGGRLELEAPSGGHDAAEEPELVLGLFAAMARSGAPLALDTESRITDSIPLLSAHLEEGPVLWRALSSILTGEFAGMALRSMHTLGVLDLILPEFHGIDALVIRDAYHRYTVDEHTFVVIDTLHELEAAAPAGAPDWRVKFGQMIRELQNPALLYLAALLHDTGKGRAGDDHARESSMLARAVLHRLEMDAYDAQQVVQLIDQHLEMSVALRRDIFDAEAVRSFAVKVKTHEALRMLTLFTYADIRAVHPDALTPWKAENLWRLSMHAANQMDRGVDEERVRASGADERIDRVVALMPEKAREVRAFLEGFPERYLTTRTPEQVKQHFEMALRLAEEPVQLAVHYGALTSETRVHEIVLVTEDRPGLFAGMAAALAAWGMNIVTADAFADASGVVVDSFRFTDAFRTLELNVTERERFVSGVREIVAGRQSPEKMLAGRRRSRRQAPRLVVETRIDFEEQPSAHSTLLQVVAQDVPGLLRTVSKTLSERGMNVEVALIDTEGETAIDVFYLTHLGANLTRRETDALRVALMEAIDENAR